MKIIHQLITHVAPFTNPPKHRVKTKCGTTNITGIRGTYTLGDALKKLDYSVNSVLCAECFYREVGQIKFDQEQPYGQSLHYARIEQDNEIIDAEEL